ncbi:hypothetical protein KI387_000655, partial [Taxus chinensis]
IGHVKGKEIMVADALSRWRHVVMASLVGTYFWSMIFQQLPHDNIYLAAREKIESQRPLEGKFEGFSLEAYGLLRHKGRIYVPRDGVLRLEILTKVHRAPYSAHPRVKKMHATSKQLYHWRGICRDMARFVLGCLECQKVNSKHQNPASPLFHQFILEWKWDTVSIEFIVGLWILRYHHDAIMVMVDKLTKLAHFFLVKTTYTSSVVTRVYLDEIIRLYGSSRKIICDCNPLYTSDF